MMKMNQRPVPLIHFFIETLFTAITDAIINVTSHGFNTSQYNWDRTTNAWKIDMAPFKGNIDNIIRNLTWGLPNTVLGNQIAHFYNYIGKVDRVSEMEGLTAIGNTTSGEKAFTLGPYSFGPKGYTATWKDHLFVHEYGHYLQHLDWGLLYLPTIAAPSLLSAIGVEDTHGTSHLTRWFEVDASNRGANYFEKKYGKNSDYYKILSANSPNGVDRSQFFDIKSFYKGYRSGYVNPRTGIPNGNQGFPISSPVHDAFDYIIPLLAVTPFLFLL